MVVFFFEKKIKIFYIFIANLLKRKSVNDFEDQLIPVILNYFLNVNFISCLFKTVKSHKQWV